MYNVGDVIDGKYVVAGVCSEQGGMGAILHVSPRIPHPFPIVLKYCRDTNEENIKRFRRESRILASYAGNGRVVNVVSANADHDPPYFVMKFYPNGDLSSLAGKLLGSLPDLERIILDMIDSLSELHTRGHFHRDIKPQNFLLDGSSIVVSDFGLSTEIGSQTGFTRSSMWWGTHGFIPPEFLSGGFKNPDATGDIFMLGKTIYVLATGRDPLYIMPADLPAPLYHLIDRCCSLAKAQRYQSLTELRQSVVAAFDVLLSRGGGIGKVMQVLGAVQYRIKNERKYDPAQVAELIEQVGLLEPEEKMRVCMDLDSEMFSLIAQRENQGVSIDFLKAYEEMVESQSYGWSFAEVIARNMKMIFVAQDALDAAKVMALDLAIRASIHMNRFAAMDTCSDMIRGVKGEPLGTMVAALVYKHRGSFVDSIEPVRCENESVARAILANKT